MTDMTNILVLPPIENLKEVSKNLPNGASVTKGPYSRLEFRFKDGGVELILNGINIKNYSMVWLSSFWSTRDLAYAAHVYLEHFGTPHTFAEQCPSKITDQINFVLNGISCPNTFYIDRHNISRYVETIENICGYPIIIKDTEGSRGRYSALVKNRAELLERMSHLPNHTKKYMFQEYVENDYDWGVLVAHGNIVSAEMSYHCDNEFRNNACNGAKEVFMKLDQVPEEIKQIALSASNTLGLTWSRSDIIVDKRTQRPYLLEVNRCPGITLGTTEVTAARDYLMSIRENATKHVELDDILMANTIANLASFQSPIEMVYDLIAEDPEETESL